MKLRPMTMAPGERIMNMKGAILFLPLLLCFLSSFIPIVFGSSGALYNFCTNTTAYSSNSAFGANLNTLLSALSNATTATGFYSFTAGNISSDRVYGLFLCRGDVSSEACRRCVVIASVDILKLCPTQREAIVWYDDCLLRYSNQSVFSNQGLVYMSNTQDIGTSSLAKFKQVLDETMGDIANQAARNQSGRKFATKDANFSGDQKLYTLAQCTADLSISACNSCLADANSRLPDCCDGKQGGRVLKSSCNVRYEIYPFYYLSDDTAPGPAPGIPPPPGPANSPGSLCCSRTRFKPLFIDAGKGGGISSQLLIAIIVPVGVSVLLFIVGCCFIRRKGKKEYEAVGESSVVNAMSEVQSLQYSLASIQAATNNFSDDNKVGEGGFGDVYKGILPNGQELAVKRLSRNSGQGAVEFKNEVVLVAKLQHRNLVRLLGFCLEGEEKILVYEFVPNKSLDYFLFDPEKQEKLDWSRRFKIIGGIARGILYLHQDSQLKIIHRDLKTSNVLLDGDMNAKISDFGMARIFGVDQTHGNTSRVVGTYGYMSPEYAMHGQFSMKSDVYSFGVLVLEIISGKMNSNFYESGYAEDLLSYAWKLWRDETPLDLLDPSLEGSYSKNEVLRCIHIALLCVQEDPEDRPSMANVIVTLNSFSINLPVPEQPAFFVGSRTRSQVPKGLETNQPTNTSVPWSVNETSITELHPR
ncbi:cysteine-rich receptor-like protein kinase 25 isoform X3 [Diospyros lotus]|uniref:cysteine-rich receptor-like protein kinase 25 isoform X3 n=1 Tax=Diospyros lotus TaxID=55363 RepID=UPI0022570F2E|nr:cysteine-rich receptor-like protein kinase 25 isoform X3 [Diospyros lotus]